MTSAVSSGQPVAGFKSLLFNGTLMFFSLGMVAIKAIWDAQLLANIDSQVFIAFGFVFPLLFTFNALGLSIANAVTSSFSRWQWIDSKQKHAVSNPQLDKHALSKVTLVAGAMGGLMSLFMLLLLPLLIQVLSAEKYSHYIQQFCNWFLVWQPVQFMAVSWQSVARGIGQYKGSASVSFCCQIAGMAISYILLYSNVVDIEPLSAIAISNLLTSLFIVIFLYLFIFRSYQSRPQTKISFNSQFKPMSKVFYNGIMTNILALVFIFFLTRLMAQQGEQVMAAQTYVARIEQLILIFFSALIASILPEIARCLRAMQFNQAREIIHRSAGYLLICGLGFVALGSLAIYWFGPKFMEPGVYSIFLKIMMFWFIAYLFQGVGLLFLQMVNIFLMPKMAPVINFIRFLVLGIPGLYFAVENWQLDGLVYGVPILQGLSLLVTCTIFEISWKKYQHGQLALKSSE